MFDLVHFAFQKSLYSFFIISQNHWYFDIKHLSEDCDLIQLRIDK